MNVRRVQFPAPDWVVVNFRQEGSPGVAVVNRALGGFEAREVFPWHLSVMLQLEDLIDNGMPSEAERDVLASVEKSLSDRLDVEDRSRPNGLALARITWKGTRELIYRMHDPEAADVALKALIATKEHSRPFDYRMDHDTTWSLAAWSLGAASRGSN